MARKKMTDAERKKRKREQSRINQRKYRANWSPERRKRNAGYLREWRIINPGYVSEWRRKNPEKASENLRRYVAKVPEKVKAWKKVSRDRNRESYNAYQRQWKEENKARIAELRDIAKAKDPERERALSRARSAKRRAHKNGVTVSEIKEIRAMMLFIANAATVRCHWCKLLAPKGKRHLDHVVPLSRGGPHSIKNLVPSCRRCNCKKFNLMPEEFLSRLKK